MVLSSGVEMKFTKTMRAAALAATALTLCLGADGQPAHPIARPSDTALYKDASAPIPARVEDLLKRMTLAEKVAQLEAVWVGKTAIQDAQHNFDMAKAEKLYPDGIGTLARPSDLEGPVSPRVVPRRGFRGRFPWRTLRAACSGVCAPRRARGGRSGDDY